MIILARSHIMRALLVGAWVVGILESVGLAVQAGVSSWGTAIQFSGGPERVESVALAGFPTFDLTLSMWLKAEQGPSQTTLVSYAVPGPCVSAFSVRSPEQLVVEVGCRTIATGINLQDSAWHHLAVIWQTEGGVMEVFVDGVSTFREENGAGATPLPGEGWVVLGRQQGCPGGCFGAEPGFKGLIDEFRVWDHARTAEQIQDDMHRTLWGPEPGLVMGWSFDEGRLGPGAGALVRDVSGSGNDGWLRDRPRRAPSQPWPILQLMGDDPLFVECHDVYAEPGAEVLGSPVMLAAGYAHSLGLQADGRLVAWGADDAGQLRIDRVTGDYVAVAAGQRHSLALQRDGRLRGWGDNVWGQVSVPAGVTNVVAIVSGTAHSLALLRDGRVLTWGYPEAAAAVIPASVTNVVAVAAGSLFNLALRADGWIVAWGRDDDGQLRVPAEATNVVSIAASYRHALALRRDGKVLAWGANAQGQVDVPEAAVNVVAIAAGYGHSLALKCDGSVVAWGDNREGQCAVPEFTGRAVAIAAGGNHSLALLADGTVLAWGRAEDGVLEVPSRLGVIESTIEITGSVDVNAPGDYVRHYAAILDEGGEMAGQRMVTVADTTAPTVEIQGEDPLVLAVGEVFVPPEAEATDACSGDLTDQLTLTGEVDVDLAGAYELIYEVTDSSGNRSVVPRAVWIVDAPSIRSLGAVLTGFEGARSARLEGGVSANGLAGSAWFEFGPSEDYADQSEPVLLSAGYEVQEVTVNLMELVPGVELHYRLAVSNAVGTVTSQDRRLRIPEQFVPGDVDGDGLISQAEMETVLAHYWSSSPAPMMTHAAAWGEGTFQFALTNMAAWELNVEVSTNLLDWEPLGTAVPVYQFRDPDAPGGPERFYRLRSP